MPISTLFGANDLATWAGIAMVVWVLVVLLVPFLNRKRQRLGDMIADTLVVDMPKAVLMPDLASTDRPARQRFIFNPEHLEIYGRYELQTLETILRNPPRTQEQYDRIHDVTSTIIRKIAFTEKVVPVDEWDFLLAFYTQQRGFLENRHLFGDSRQDKFHADDTEQAQIGSRAGDGARKQPKNADAP